MAFSLIKTSDQTYLKQLSHKAGKSKDFTDLVSVIVPKY